MLQKRTVAVVAQLGLKANGLGGAPAVSAAAQPAIVVWAGPLVPGTELHGVRLKANGEGTRLVVKSNHRASAKVTFAGPFSPTSAQLAEIRAAAKKAFAKPGVKATSDTSTGSHGGYASAVIKIGPKTRTLLGVNTSSAKLRALLVALNKALPPSAQLDDPETGLAQTSDGPSTAPCPPGQGPTTISRRVSLDEAAQLGIAELTAKGGFAGDSVAVDAKWQATDKPVTVKVNVEFSGYPGGPTASQVEASIESRLPPRTAVDGTKVKFDIVAHGRSPGAAPLPCFHQIKLVDDPGNRGDAGLASQNPLVTPQAGEWPTGRGPIKDRQIWTHETLHFAGLGDRYKSFFQIGKKLYPIPDDVDFKDKKQLEEWAKEENLDVNAGKAGTKPIPGFEQDIMAEASGSEKLQQFDVDAFAIAGANELTIEGKPGDLLLNKQAEEQNLMVGAPFELTVKPGKAGHVDGMVAYCIDLSHHRPSSGRIYDVLGSAGDQPQESMHYLQRVADVGAALQTEPLTASEGVQDAIWRITDDWPTFDESGDAVLAMAGVPDIAFDAPHFTDPNAGSPTTGAVSTTGVLPAPPPIPYVKGLHVRPTKLAAGKRRTVKVRIALRGARDKVRLELQRRQGRRWHRLKRLGARKLRPGATKLRLHLPALRRGAFRLVAIGKSSSATAGLLVR